MVNLVVEVPLLKLLLTMLPRIRLVVTQEIGVETKGNGISEKGTKEVKAEVEGIKGNETEEREEEVLYEVFWDGTALVEILNTF